MLIFGFTLGYKGQWLATSVLVLLAIVLADISYRFIEFPLWKGKFSHYSNKQTLVVGLLASAVCLLLTFHTLRSLPTSYDISDESNVWRTDLPIIYQMPCDSWYQDAALAPCIFNAGEHSKTVVLLGDSIGAQWFSAIPAIFQAPQWQTIVLTKSACAIVDEDFYYERIGKTYDICRQWRENVLDYLATLKPDVLIIGNSPTYAFNDEQWVKGSQRIFERVKDNSGAVFIIPGAPRLNIDGPGCLARALKNKQVINDRTCQSHEKDAASERATRLLQQAVAPYTNFYLLNLNKITCPQDVCNAISPQGVVVYRDSQHLTDTFVRSQIPAIYQQLQKALTEKK